MAEILNCKFPSESLLPKAETGVINFLNKYPQYNGDDVIIAIFDSGVDPKSSGIQVTPNNEVKVIGRFDCTGCGDIDTSKIVNADVGDIYITGLSGRKLKLTNFMKTNIIDGSQYRVGLKSLSEIYPSKVKDKMISDFKIKSWDEPHKRSLAAVQRNIDAFDAKHNSNLTNLSIHDKLIKEENDSSLDFLNYSEKKFSELKSTYDCVLFLTNKGWVAIIDLTQSGDLDNALQITEYTNSHDVQSIDNYLSISINVHNDGNVLEIVGMCSSHGTHVASIASGYSGNASCRKADGVAPGAKIISFTIGDGRLGSMETGVGLVRAIVKVMELCSSGTNIDVINMSYGEHAHWSNNGRIGELMNEVVNKYGVVWVASAGNHGPALCTIGTPPDISQASLIGVGAYVSPEMMEAEYALRQKLPANVYTWTSRDPCIDGGQGVTICAPGAAITSVPEFTLTKAQLMNGTSMAAPHVAGAIALLISGMKKKKLNYTPYSIKRALWNTASKLSYVDNFAQGNGLMNVEKAFEHLVQYSNEIEQSIRFGVSVGINHAKGIHIRERILLKPMEFNVSIEPVFLNDNETEPKDKINFNMRLTLIPSETWVQCGAFLDLCYQSRTISVFIDPKGLTPGVHSATIKAYDTNCIEKGIIFEIPITVVQPEVQLNETSNIFFSGNPITCKPNTIIRKFLLVPNNATYAVLRLISTDSECNTGGRFLVHTMQILTQKYCKALETQKILPVTNDIETVHAFKCEGNNILEICIAKYWSNFGDVSIKYSIEFHGVYTNGGNVMHAANGIHRLDLNTNTAQEISPTIVLKNAVVVLKPNDTKITALTLRDVIPNGRQIYQNVFTYTLHLIKPFEVSLHVPLFSSVLYESEFEAQFWMLYDTNKMMVACGDAYSNSNYVKLEKGDYTIKLQVRHEKKDLLEKVSEAVMLATIKLSNTISLDIYPTFNSAAVQGKKLSPVKMCARSNKPIYVLPLINEKATKSGIPPQTSWLDGTITFCKDDLARKCDCTSFQYVLIQGTKNNNGIPNGSKDVKPKIDEYREGLRDFKTNMIAKLDRENAEDVYNELLVDHPNHLHAHLAFINNLDAFVEIKAQYPFGFKAAIQSMLVDKKDKLTELKVNLEKIAELSEKIINETEKETLLAYYGLKSDSRADAAKIKINMDKQKYLLLDAYFKRTVSLCKINIIDKSMHVFCHEETFKLHTDKIDEELIEELNKNYIEISKFIDLADLKVTLFSIWHGYTNGQYGRMTKYLIKNYEDKLQREALEEIVAISIKKEWLHVADGLNKAIVTFNPVNYGLF